MSALDSILKICGDETPLYVVFGDFSCRLGDYIVEIDVRSPHPDVDVPQIIPPEAIGEVMPFENAKQYLERFDCDGGFGHPKTYAFYVWTEKSVIFVATYDGATWLEKVPRNPCSVVPKLIGGG